MSGRRCNPRCRRFEIFEILLGQEHVAAVIGKDHAFVTHKENAQVPFGDFALVVVGRFHHALIPGDRDGWHLAARTVLVAGQHGGWSKLWMRLRSLSFDGERVSKFERPKGQVINMAAHVGHGAAPEVPPAIPSRSWPVDGVKGPLRSWTKKEIPVQPIRYWGGAFRSVLGADNVLIWLATIILFQ